MENKVRLSLDHVQDQLWAIRDGKLDEINAVVQALLEGKQPPLYDRFAGIGTEAPVGSGEKPYAVQKTSMGRVAMIPIFGTIMKRANLFSEWSGGCSSQKVMSMIAKALDDDDVDIIGLDVDSPGGAVDGTKTLADFIFNARGKKPIVAFSDGTIASAAYWIASAADSIHICETACVGSIGVRLTHYDMSGKDRANGVVRTTIFAGKFKAIADDTGPLSQEGRDYLQELVDKTYGSFLADVARNRGVSMDAAVKMAEGRLFIGKDAVDIGLVDGIGQLDAAIGRTSYAGRRQSMEKKILEMQAALDQANARIAAIEEEKRVALEQAELEKKAAAEEQARLALELTRKGYENTISQLVSEGKVTPAIKEAGICDFLMAVDGLGEVEIGGAQVKASEWFLAKFASEPIVKIDGHVASTETAKAGGSDKDDQDAMDIAKYANCGMETE